MLFTGRARIGLVIVAVLAVPAMLLAACGGGDDDDSDADQPTDQVTSTPVDDDGDGGDGGGNGEGEAFEEVYPVNQTFWYQAFMVEIGDAVFAATEPDFSGEQDFTVTLDATFTNEGADESFMESNVALVTPGDTYTLNLGSDIPSVPGGLSASGNFIFVVDEGFEIDGAYLVIGGADEQQAQVPMGPNGGDLVALEPAEAPVTGTISLSLIDLTFTSAELRSDYPASHTQVEAGKLALTLHFDATSRKSGNWSIFANEFALTLPGGSSIGAEGADLPGLPGSDAGTETQDLYLRFLVDDPAEGTYTLRFTPPDRWLEEGDPSEATLEFEL